MFYTINNVNESVNFLNNVPEVDFKHEANLEGALMNIYESEVNWNSLMEAVAMDELVHFVENGEMMVYEGAKLDSFFSKMKEFFKSLWTKIKGFFEKFFAVINSFILNDKAFVKKYEKALREKSTKDFEYKGYKFTNLDTSKQLETVANGIKNDIENAKKVEGQKLDVIQKLSADLLENETKDLDAVRASFVNNKPTSVESDEYTKELFKFFRDGEDSPKTITTVSVDDQLNYISNAKDNIKSAKDDLKEYERIINKVISDLNTIEKGFKGDDEANKEINAAKSTYILREISRTKAKMSIAQTYSGAKVTALKARNRQAKSICVKILSYKHEGVDLSSYEEGSLLNQVNFI